MTTLLIKETAMTYECILTETVGAARSRPA